MTNGWKMTFLLGFCLFNIRGEGLAVSFREGITNSPHFQWLFLVPVKGGIGSIFHPPEGKDYKWCF